MAESDLAGHRGEAHRAQCPGRGGRSETDLGQILRLMDLNEIPGEQTAEIARCQPPERFRGQDLAQGPAGTGFPTPLIRCRLNGRGSIAVGLQAERGGIAPEQQVERNENDENDEAERPAAGAPARFGD